MKTPPDLFRLLRKGQSRSTLLPELGLDALGLAALGLLVYSLFNIGRAGLLALFLLAFGALGCEIFILKLLAYRKRQQAYGKVVQCLRQADCAHFIAQVMLENSAGSKKAVRGVVVTLTTAEQLSYLLPAEEAEWLAGQLTREISAASAAPAAAEAV